MKFKMTMMGLILSAVIVSQAACGKGNNGAGKADTNKAEQEAAGGEAANDAKVGGLDVITEGILGEFQTLVSKQPEISEIYTFIKDKSKDAKKDEVTSMLIGMEATMIQKQAVLMSEYSVPEVQDAFTKADQAKIDFNQADKLQDAKLKTLVEKAKANGFKIKMSKGVYGPVIDYTTYKDLSANATEDMIAFVDIMATESANPYAKGTSLAIGWDEVIKRAIAAEEFLKKNESSAKADAVKSLYAEYKRVAMFGLDSTPVFDLKTKALNADAKKAFETSISSNTNSEITKTLKEFLNVVSQNGNKLNEKVEEFRNKAIYS